MTLTMKIAEHEFADISTSDEETKRISKTIAENKMIYH